MKTISNLFQLVFVLLSTFSFAQTDTLKIVPDYTTIEEALKNPLKVKRLNLSNQIITFETNFFQKFENLEYLSLKNDHLKELPKEIGNLKKLKVLDISGNDFEILPTEFKNLFNLEELYLNDEINFNLDKSISTLKQLPALKILHLSNDKLEKLPQDFEELKNLEMLYLDTNNFKFLPKQIKGLDHLQFLDLRKNPLQPTSTELQNINFGFKIRL